MNVTEKNLRDDQEPAFHYDSKYFNQLIFRCDYRSIAESIVQQYSPQSVIEVGCGNGDLSRELAMMGVDVFALDGYADPRFSADEKITFKKVDFNDTFALKNHVATLAKKFDVAICLEVAEHLDPSVSSVLIEVLTSVADVVIFSAAVPGQGGDGHINCRPREFWHDLFSKHNFKVVDTIREKLKEKDGVATWYRLNILDYARKSDVTSPETDQLVRRLIASESEASSAFYRAQKRYELRDQLLRMQPFRFVFWFRNSVKKLIGRPPITLDEAER
jgi:SAM-dependent methyltransferase